MTRVKSFFLFPAAVLLLFAGCRVFENETLVPGYIYVPSFTLSTHADGSQGDNVSELSDIWVYESGSVEGAFKYPLLIPIQKNGPTNISFDAGVMRTGQSNERIPYPLISRYNVTLDLQPGKIDTVIPAFRYYDLCEFLMIEDFDNASGFLWKTYRGQEGDSIMRYNGPLARTPGKSSGQVLLSDSTDDYEMVSVNSFPLRSGERVFLEVDYNSDQMLRFGMYATDITGVPSLIPMFYSNPTNGSWKRVYIDLSEEIGVRGAGTTYQLFIRMLRTPDGSLPLVLLDNIKLIRF